MNKRGKVDIWQYVIFIVFVFAAIGMVWVGFVGASMFAEALQDKIGQPIEEEYGFAGEHICDELSEKTEVCMNGICFCYINFNATIEQIDEICLGGENHILELKKGRFVAMNKYQCLRNKWVRQ